MQSLTEDVTRQMEREKSLQQRYAELQAKVDELQESLQKIQQTGTQECVQDGFPEEDNPEYDAADSQENIDEPVAAS